ncbi:MAG: DUF2924 domain-containing protein [Planctomycetota bacterium]|nr:MAG: DUF2924 domain-containing protein [Planctomycetota bacterium]
MTTLASQIAQLPHLPLAELVTRYTAAFGTEPPIRQSVWLWRRLAWQMQADARGGLSDAATARLETLTAQLPRTTRPVEGIRRPGDLVPGQHLERPYKGNTVRVAVLDSGFEWDGATYTSLSAVAKAVTGSKSINGRLWFGLTKRKRGS